MKRTAIHIYLSHFENESRILKETKSLISHNIVDKIIVLALGKEGLAEMEEFDEGRFVYRVRPRLFRNKKLGFGLSKLLLLIKLFDMFFKYLSVIRKEKPVFINLHLVMVLPLIPFIKIVSPRSILIYDAHELETETNGLHGIRKRIFKIFERLWIKKFKLVIVVGAAIEDWYRNEYGIQNIVTVMNCPLYQNVTKRNLFREEFGIAADSTIFLYQGAIFQGRGIETMLDAFAAVNDERYTLVIMGYGRMEEYVRAYADRYSNIFFKKAVSPDIVLNYTGSADIGISIIENICLSYYYCLPNKIFEYLMAEIPCIVSNMKEMSDYVTRYGTGVIAKDTSKEALIEAIRSIDHFDMDQFRRNIETVKKQFCWQTQEAIMIQAYNKLIAAK